MHEVMKGKFGFLALAAIALASIGCVDRGKQQQAKQTQKLVTDPVRPVTVESVRIRNVSETLGVTGEVTTSQDSQVGAKRSGRITSVLVRDGDPVKAGQLLATLDNSDIQSQLTQAYAALSGAQSQLSQAKLNAAVGPTRSNATVASAEAGLRSAKAALKKAQEGARPEERVRADWQVKSAKTNLDTAEKDLERKKALVAEGALAKSQLDLAQNAYMSALTAYNAALQNQLLNEPRQEDLTVAREAVRSAEENLRQAKATKQLDPLLRDQVATAQAQVDTARAQVNIAKQALSDTQIRAPFEGRVAGKPIETGTVVSPGQQIVRLVGSSGLYFEGDVPESQVSQVQVGKPVTVTIDAVPGRTFPAVVAAVSPVSQDTGRLFKARIQISGDLTGVRPGMFASGDILVRQIAGAMVVPTNAVVNRDSKTVVFIVESGKAHQVEVKTGLAQGNFVQVTGLVNGQQVVVRGQEDIVDGTPVKVGPTTVADARMESGG